MTRQYVTALAVLAVVVTACGTATEVAPATSPPVTAHPATAASTTLPPEATPAVLVDLAGVGFDVHKVVGCQCCNRWSAYLRDHGAKVSIEPDPDLVDYKEAQGVPREASSCHTAIVEGYIVEGHVPVEAILKMLNERPDAVGIAVPGMPEDSPGMGGDEMTWRNTEVFLIGHDGALTRYEF